MLTVCPSLYSTLTLAVLLYDSATMNVMRMDVTLKSIKTGVKIRRNAARGLGLNMGVSSQPNINVI
jgi:hypothetical protein